MGALDFLKTEQDTGSAISPLKDPFSQSSIESIHIHIWPKRTFGKPMHCSVEFENGKTEGTQNFDGSDLGAMMKEVQAFIDSLKKGADNG